MINYKAVDRQYAGRWLEINGREVQFNNYQADVDEEVAYYISRMKANDIDITNLYHKVPFNPDSWKKDRRIIWSQNYASANGYGNVAENTVINLQKMGVNVFNPGVIAGSGVSGGDIVSEEVKKSLNKRIFPDCLEIQYVQPPAYRLGIIDRSWMYTMFETTVTPHMWIDRMNQAERILTPSSWVIPYWKERGIKVPVDVYGHGFNPSIYSYIDRPIDRPIYTFLHYGQLSERKGTDIAVKAFIEEFKGQDDVQLVLKNTYPFFPFVTSDMKNIKRISATYTLPQMRQMLSEADCFVFPTRGEGFGLTPFEAMASGLPTIITNWGGPLDFINKEDTLLCDYDMVSAQEFAIIYKDNFELGEGPGEWAQAKVEQVKAHMRWCYNNRENAKEMGRKAAERLAESWKWSDKVQELVDIIDRNI